MIDIDYGPGVLLGIIIVVFIVPALYGLLFVDKFWRKHKSRTGDQAEDAFR